MHLSICNLDIPRAYHAHLTPSLSPGVGNLTLELCGGGEFDTKPRRWRIWPFVHDERREKLTERFSGQDIAFATEWLRRNSGTLLNVSTKFLYPILIWKRPTGTYSVLFWNDLPSFINGKKKCPRGGVFAHPASLTCGAFEQLFGTGWREFDPQNRKIQMPGGLPWWGLQIDRLPGKVICNKTVMETVYQLRLNLYSTKLRKTVTQSNRKMDWLIECIHNGIWSNSLSLTCQVPPHHESLWDFCM